MDNIWIWVVVIVVALVIAPAIGGAFHSNERAQQFEALGDIAGKPIADIISEVGKPNSISVNDEGNSVYQWIDQVGHSMTHYAILVDQEGNALGFSHQAQF